MLENLNEDLEVTSEIDGLPQEPEAVQCGKAPRSMRRKEEVRPQIIQGGRRGQKGCLDQCQAVNASSPPTRSFARCEKLDSSSGSKRSMRYFAVVGLSGWVMRNVGLSPVKLSRYTAGEVSGQDNCLLMA